MLKMYFLLYFSLAASIHVSLAQSSCPKYEPVPNFNMSAFGRGSWYDHGRYPNDFETKNECLWSINDHGDDYIAFKYHHLEHDTIFVTEAIGRLAPDAGTSGKIILTYEVNDESHIPIEIPVSVTIVEYDQFAVFYGCSEDGGVRKVYSWIVTRKPVLDDAVKEKINNYIKSSNIKDFDDFLWIDNSGDDCKISDEMM